MKGAQPVDGYVMTFKAYGHKRQGWTDDTRIEGKSNKEKDELKGRVGGLWHIINM